MFVSSRALFVVAFGATVAAQSCPSSDHGGKCDFEPTNPYICGPDYACSYTTMCHAEYAGYDIDKDCCQAPQPSSCPFIFDPQVCGSKQCPYDNECIASLAGYTPDQCESPPPECPKGTADCSGSPSNPFTCGPNKCEYSTTCDAESAGWDLRDDCCQDTRGNSACSTILAPVSCGPPGGKQCGYSNECTAQAAGYTPSTQCCGAVPDGIACASIYEPVECGSIPCVYANQCEATAAGNSESDCCPQAVGMCTQENDPVACGQNKCLYSSQSCADLAGFASNQCCKQPKDVSSCPKNYDPYACSSAGCVYDNSCIAELAGFDVASCVPLSSVGTMSADSDTSGASGKSHAIASAGAILFAALV